MTILQRQFNRSFSSSLKAHIWNESAYDTQFDLGNVNRSWTDYVTFDPYENPGWRYAIVRGDSATTSCYVAGQTHKPGGYSSFECHQSKESPVYGHLENHTHVYGDIGLYSYTPALRSDLIDPALDGARQLFIKRALEAQRQCMVLVTGGELGQALRMIRNPLQSLYKGKFRYLERVKKYASKRGMTNAQKKSTISNLWLEGMFGWLPLYSDIQGGAEALAQVLTYRLPRIRVSGKAAREFKVSYPDENNFVNGCNLKLFLSEEHTASVRLTGAVKISTASLAMNSEAFGARPRDFLPTIWELIPYSFLVDYFTNASNVIDAFTFPTSDISWIEIGTEVKAEAKMNYVSFEPVNLTDWAVNEVQRSPGTSAVHGNRQSARTPFIGSLIPSFRFEIPGLGLKWLNMGALFRNSKAVSQAIAKTR